MQRAVTRLSKSWQLIQIFLKHCTSTLGQSNERHVWMARLPSAGKPETSVQRQYRRRRRLGSSPTGGSAPRAWQRPSRGLCHDPDTSRHRTEPTPPGSLFQRGGRMQGSGRPADHVLHGAQWKAVAGERVDVSHPGDRREEEGQGTASLLPIATLTLSLGSSRLSASSDCSLPSLRAVGLFLFPWELLCHY